MERDKIIEQICSFYDFELVNYFFSDRYDDFDVNEKISSDKFKRLMDKYNISITELAESYYYCFSEEEGINLWECKRQIQGIGTKYKKEYQRKGRLDITEKEYVKYPRKKQREALQELLSYRVKKYPLFGSLSVSLKLSKMFDGIVFLRENNIIEPDIMGFSTRTSLLNVLYSMRDTELKGMLDRLQNNNEDDDEVQDAYLEFINSGTVSNLMLLKYISTGEKLEEIYLILDDICMLTFYMNQHSYDQQTLFLKELKKRRTHKKITPPIEKILTQTYPRVNLDEEEDKCLRYKEIPNFLSKCERDVNNVIPQAFLCMTPLIWEIIQQTFRTFINPSGKTAENFFEKCIEKSEQK